ncbi:MAG: ABC transporter permease subunit [Enterocloster clostridioformis]
MKDRLIHGILPGAALAITGISNIALHTREKLAEVMESDYVLFASQGESEWSIIRRHGIRNILLPAMTLQLASVSEDIRRLRAGGAGIFLSGPGTGCRDGRTGGDVPLLMGITTISAAIVFLGNFTANLLYGTVDPRIRRSRG